MSYHLDQFSRTNNIDYRRYLNDQNKKYILNSAISILLVVYEPEFDISLIIA
jgi:hypothetical protein